MFKVPQTIYIFSVGIGFGVKIVKISVNRQITRDHTSQSIFYMVLPLIVLY